MTRIIAMTLLVALTACGNKGPLVLRDAAARDESRSADAPAEAPATEPAASEPVVIPEPAPVDPVPGASGTRAR